MEQVRFPYGGAFLVDFSRTDRAIDNLYAEQRQREVYQQRESAQLDNMLQQEFGKIRSVDTPEVIQGYQRYKELKKKLLFDKRAQRDPQLYNALQRDVGLALQDVYKGINRSQELLNNAKLEDQNRLKSPTLYDDNYGNLRAAFWNTPMSKLAETDLGDLSNPDTYRYKGSNTDFQKILNTAIGQPKPVFSLEESVDKGGLQTKITPFSFGNTPAQVKESLLGAMGMHRSGRDAEFLWDNLPQEEIETTIAQYKNIPQSKWERMGLPGMQDLTPKNSQSKSENYAAYLAMKYAINNEPKQGTPQYRNNKEAQMEKSMQDWMAKEGIRQKNRKELADLRFQYRQQGKEMDRKQEGLWLGEYLGRLVDDSEQSLDRFEYKYRDGKSVQEAEIPVDPLIAKTFARSIGGKSVEPDFVRVMADGKIRPIFFQYDDKGRPKKTGDRYAVDELLSQPISMEQFKLNLSKHTQSAKQRAAEMGAKPESTTIKIQDLRSKYNY